MPNKKCSVCDKTAYPLESVEAGGKTWHKLCFKCSQCKITLNVASFKAHEGGVFCSGCVPRATHTQVTDSVATRAALSTYNTLLQALSLSITTTTTIPSSITALTIRPTRSHRRPQEEGRRPPAGPEGHW